jgi:hypothetical protein
VSKVSGLRSSWLASRTKSRSPIERRGEHRVEGPPEPGDFVVELLGNSSRTPATLGSPAPPGSICAAWPRQCSTGLRADRASG